jgi:hypothetical protein
MLNKLTEASAAAAITSDVGRIAVPPWEFLLRRNERSLA